MKIFSIVVLFVLTTLAQQRWDKLNGPLGGVASVHVFGDTILAALGGSYGTIYYSFNAGVSWNQSKLKISDPIIDFIKTEDEGIIASALHEGLFKSFDLENWSKIYSDGNAFGYLGKDIDKNLYAGTINGSAFVPDKIITSTNNGTSWEISLNNYYSDFGNFLLFVDSTLFLGGDEGILQKKSGPSSWVYINLDTVPSGDYTIFSDPSGYLYAFNVGTRMVMSPDAGISWKYLDPSGFLHFGNQMNSCIYNNRLIGGMNQTGINTVWGVVLSDDKGYTWRQSDNLGIPPKIASAMSLDKTGDITYLGTSAAGVFKSTDYGESWVAINNGITAASTNQLCIDDDGTIYTANWSNGFQKSTDEGKTWEVINNGITNSISFSIVADDNGNLIGGTQEGIFRSTDEGATWVPTTPVENNFSYILSKDRYNRIYSVLYGRGIFRTTDLGYTWERIDNGFGSQGVFGIYIDHRDNIYAGTFGGRIFRTTDDGLTWTQLYDSPRPFATTCDIVVTDDGYIFASTNYEGIIRSTDKGVSWEIVKTDTLYNPKTVIALYKDGLYAAGSGNKIFYSSDRGESWTDFTSNLEYNTIWSKTYDNEGKLYFATDEGVWRLKDFSTTSINEQLFISSYTLDQNYPNPFNPSTKISYNLKAEGYVKLIIYDIKGELVSTLVNEKQQAGSYEVDFTLPGNISTGVYIYRLTVSDNSSHNVIFSNVKKMVYLK